MLASCLTLSFSRRNRGKVETGAQGGQRVSSMQVRRYGAPAEDTAHGGWRVTAWRPNSPGLLLRNVGRWSQGGGRLQSITEVGSPTLVSATWNTELYSRSGCPTAPRMLS